MDLSSLLFINLTAAAIRGILTAVWSLRVNLSHDRNVTETIRTKEGQEPVSAEGSGSLQPMYRKVIRLFAVKKHASNTNKYNNITVNLAQTTPGENLSGMTSAQVVMEELMY